MGDGNAPSAVNGLSYRLGVGETVSFTSLTEATKVEGIETETYTYTYVANGTTATLTLTEEPGDYDVYVLNFATGNYTRAKYRKNVLRQNGGGVFALPLAP